MNRFLLVLIVISFLACNNSNTEEEPEQDPNTIFFPISGNIKAELKELDSLPLAVIKYTVEDGKADTSVVEKSELHRASELLITPDISSPELKKYYREAVFMDNTINAVTMSYTTKAEEPVVRKIEVMMHPDTEKVRSIYVEKRERSGDTIINRKMVWTTGKNLQVITIRNIEGQPETLKTEKYNWELAN